MLTLSHASDASFAHAPKRLIIRGGFVAYLWTDMFLEVWKRWCEYTESNEDVRSSGVMWDITSPSKIAEVREGDTAAHARKYHHWFSIQGRSVIVTAISPDAMLTKSVIDLTKKVLTISIKLLWPPLHHISENSTPIKREKTWASGSAWRKETKVQRPCLVQIYHVFERSRQSTTPKSFGAKELSSNQISID